jgi:hypothetical protein
MKRQPSRWMGTIDVVMLWTIDMGFLGHER